MVLAFHQFLPFEAIFYSLQVLVLRKRNTITFFMCSLNQLMWSSFLRRLREGHLRDFEVSAACGQVTFVLPSCVRTFREWTGMGDAGQLPFSNVSPCLKNLDSVQNYSKAGGSILWPPFSRLCLSSGHSCLWLFLVWSRTFWSYGLFLPISKNAKYSQWFIKTKKRKTPTSYLLNSFRCPCSLSCNHWMWMVLSGTFSLGKCPWWESKRRVITGTILMGWRLNCRKSAISSCLRIPSERYCSFK